VATVAREVAPSRPLPILDINYRTRQLAFRRKQISEWLASEHAILREEVELGRSNGQVLTEEDIQHRVAFIEQDAVRQEKDALATFGMLEGSDPRIAPLRRALAVWGLSADDIGDSSLPLCFERYLTTCHRCYLNPRHGHEGKCGFQIPFLSRPVRLT
jgi:fatty acid synthase subunit alpha